MGKLTTVLGGLFLVAQTRCGDSRDRNVLTQHNDNQRTGAYLAETVLTPDRVKTQGMVLQYSRPVDGQIQAQLLYARGIKTDTGVHNVVFAVTENNTVFAYDADNTLDSGLDTGLLWKKTLPQVTDPLRPYARWTHGILSTPVIDLDTGRILVVYALANLPHNPADGGCAGTSFDCAFHLASLDLSTGTVEADVRIPTPPGGVPFEERNHRQRPGLLLTADPLNPQRKVLYVAFGGGGPEWQIEFHGWVMQFDPRTLALKRAFCTTPLFTSVAEGGGIWQGGAGLAADSRGNVYFQTGNGSDSAGSYGNSIVRLKPEQGGFKVDAFSAKRDDYPEHQVQWSNSDIDLGAGGVMLIPGAQRLVGGGKTGVVYLIDTESPERLQKVQSLAVFENSYLDPPDPAQQEVLRYAAPLWGPHLHGAPTYWEVDRDTSYVYHWAERDHMKRLTYRRNTGMFDTTPEKTQERALDCNPGGCPMPAGMTSLSANGRRDGIVWATLANGGDVGKLFAFDAITMQKIWEGEQPTIGHFVPPTIADGKVFVATQNTQQIRVYGLGLPYWWSRFPALCPYVCAPAIRDPNRPVPIHISPHSDFCANCTFRLAPRGAIVGMRLGPYGTIEAINVEGRLQSFDAKGNPAKTAEIVAQVPAGTFEGCAGCGDIIARGGVIRGIASQKDRVRFIVADFDTAPQTTRMRYLTLESRLKDLPPADARRLQPPAGVAMRYVVAAVGERIYVCEGSPVCKWVAKDQAVPLVDQMPVMSGHRHDVTLGTMAKAGVFEASDGSSFTAMPGPPGVPVKGAEEWRLFNGKGAGKGIFGDLSHVLRFDTKGGLPPGDLPAETGAQQTVPFAATYVFYAPAPNGR